jgi:dephospho-CoA kinase
VRRQLEVFGFATIDSDSVGHEVLAPDGPAFASVASRWPEAVSEGVIDRKKLAEIVFSDSGQLEVLESLTHPHIFGAINSWVERIEGSVVVEIPLLHKVPEGVWTRVVVDCDDEIRVDRLVSRGMTPESARARMDSQASRAEWLAIADIVIPNHGSLQDLTEAVDNVMEMVNRQL